MGNINGHNAGLLERMAEGLGAEISGYDPETYGHGYNAWLLERIGEASAGVNERLSFLELLKKDGIMTWDEVHDVVSAGKGAEWFRVGDQLSVDWTDDSGKVNTFMFDVMHHMDGSDADHPLVELEDGSMVPGMVLQAHRTIPFGTQFDAKEAFYYTEGGLDAGTYCFDVEVDIKWGSGAFGEIGTKSYSITLTKAAPAGSQFVFSGDPYSSQISGMSAQVFDGFTTTTAAQTCPITAGTSGTKLGTMSTSVNGGFNEFPRATYGDNAWHASGLREWLNSDAEAGAWDVMSTPWDRPYALYSSRRGFLAGLPADMVSHIGRVKVMTQTHPGDQLAGGISTTYDRVFPPSARQHFFSNYLYATTDGYESEGLPWDYWRQLAAANGRTDPWVGWQTYPELITYDNSVPTSARNAWLRSAYRYVPYGNHAGVVNASGTVSSNGAYGGNFVAPACVLI